jgi:hypothetical protein
MVTEGPLMRRSGDVEAWAAPNRLDTRTDASLSQRMSWFAATDSNGDSNSSSQRQPAAVGDSA